MKMKGTIWSFRGRGSANPDIFLFIVFQSVVNPVIMGKTIGDLKKLNQKGYKSWEI